jgi:hypothetical protein
MSSEKNGPNAGADTEPPNNAVSQQCHSRIIYAMRRRCHHHHIRLASAVAHAVDVLGAIIGIVVIAGVVVMAVVIRTSASSS